jgi:sortase (surface protein transpeptidase)
VLVTVAAVLLGVRLNASPVHRSTTATTVTTTTVTVPVQRTLATPARLTSSTMSLNAPAVAVPLIVEIPAIAVRSHVLAVGMTKAHAMAAPEGGANSANWGDTFWYRGSSVPGASGTATIAGHIDDAFGRYAVFGRLKSLVAGDRIIIRNTRTGSVERFVVTSTHAYTLAQAKTRKVLNLIYGTGPPRGLKAQPSKDGRAHLSLVTCAGTWNTSIHTHDERLVVTAVRVS